MKKLLVLLTALALSSTCFAYLEEDKTSDIDVLRAQGFSESMLKSVDLTNANNKGINSNYQRRYAPKKPRGIRAGNAYTKVKLYVDPIQDDGLFGEHNINFTNTFYTQENGYSSLLKEKKEKKSKNKKVDEIQKTEPEILEQETAVEEVIEDL